MEKFWNSRNRNAQNQDLRQSRGNSSDGQNTHNTQKGWACGPAGRHFFRFRPKPEPRTSGVEQDPSSDVPAAERSVLRRITDQLRWVCGCVTEAGHSVDAPQVRGSDIHEEEAVPAALPSVEETPPTSSRPTSVVSMRDAAPANEQPNSHFGDGRDQASSGGMFEVLERNAEASEEEGQQGDRNTTIFQMEPIDLQDTQMKIWEGSLSKEKIEHLKKRMKTGKILSRETITGGVTKPEKVTLESGIVGILKSEKNPSGRNNKYKHEIAAYELDQFLGVNMVALTVLYDNNEEKGSLQLWVDNLPEGRGLSLTNSDARFFVMLIGNTDGCLRGKNFQCLGDQVVLFDNGDAFGLETEAPLKYSLTEGLSFDYQKVTQFTPNPSILKKAGELNKEMLDKIGWLSEKEIKALLRRRNTLFEAISQKDASGPTLLESSTPLLPGSDQQWDDDPTNFGVDY